MAQMTAQDNIPKPEQKVKEAIAPRPARNYRALIFQGYVAIAAIAFLVLFGLVWGVPYLPIDLIVTQAIQSYNAAWFSTLMAWISFPGSPPYSFFLVTIIVVGLYVLGLRWEAVCSLIAGAGSSLADTLVKAIVHRARPAADIVHVVQQISGYSFPSGHVVFYAAFLGFLIFLAFTVLKKRVVWRGVIFVVLGFLIATIGVSRIELGAHWFSDVLGAYLLGSLWLALTIIIYRWGKPRFFVHQPVAPEQPVSKGQA